MTHKDYTDGLRQIADFYDQHPEIPVPRAEIIYYPVNDKATLFPVIQALGTFEKDYFDTLFYISKTFGSVALKFCFMRATICERRVIGKKHIEARFIGAHEEEIVEWDCHPILKEEPEQQAEVVDG